MQHADLCSAVPISALPLLPTVLYQHMRVKEAKGSQQSCAVDPFCVACDTKAKRQPCAQGHTQTLSQHCKSMQNCTNPAQCCRALLVQQELSDQQQHQPLLSAFCKHRSDTVGLRSEHHKSDTTCNTTTPPWCWVRARLRDSSASQCQPTAELILLTFPSMTAGIAQSKHCHLSGTQTQCR